MTTLEHANDQCTAYWLRPLAHGKVRCPECGAVHEGTPENRDAARMENLAGLMLRRLASDGVSLIGREVDGA